MHQSTQVQWVIQRNLLPLPTLEAFRQAFAEHDIPHEEVVSVPFSAELPALRNPAATCIFYGSTTLLHNAYRSEQHRTGVFFDPTTFTVANYLARWPTQLLNQQVWVESLADFAGRPHPPESQWFVRPNNDTKSFAGQVLSMARLRAWQQELANLNEPQADLTPDSLLAFSPPQRIEKEWRHVLVGGQLISSTRYQWRGETSVSTTDVPAELRAFVAECCAQYQPHPVFVLDTALANGSYRIIECNCFNGTGFYAPSEIAPVVRAVTQWRRADVANSPVPASTRS